jgi:hypothetical protein
MRPTPVMIPVNIAAIFAGFYAVVGEKGWLAVN